jgi:hypothetical protein
VGDNQRGGKGFFFEKKKQKTLDYKGLATGVAWPECVAATFALLMY